MSLVTVKGVQLHVQLDGAEGAPWIVLSNSLGANLNMWSPQIPLLSRGYRIPRYDMGHGFLQGPMHRLTDQRDAIWRTMDAIEAFCGTRPRSWESPGLTETETTLDLLREAGVDYVADWVMDDLPQDIETPYGVITSIPYTVEVNDITVHALQHHDSEVFLTRGQRQFERLYQEAAENARVMAISIHPYITGVPHRIAALEALFDYIGGHEDVAWMTASEIGDWYRGQMAEH